LRRLRAGAALLLAVGLAAPRPAHAFPDPLLERLVGIESTGLGVLVTSGPDANAPCQLAEAPLERRGLELMRAAGLRAYSRAERREISRRNGELMRRGTQALREGRAPAGADTEEGRLRREGLEFSVTLPLTILMLGTSLVEIGGERVCVLAAHAIVTVQAARGATVPGTGRMFIGGLRLWERQARAFAAPEARFQALATERVEDIVSRFIATWREANGR